MIAATAMTSRDKNSSERYRPLRRKSSNPFAKDAIIDLDHADNRMRFNNSQDPIHFVFDYIEDKPVKVLAKEFAKETLEDIAKFVSKVTKKFN